MNPYLTYISLLFLFISQITHAQLSNIRILGLPRATTTEMRASETANPKPDEGALIYNETQQAVYMFNGTQWRKLLLEDALIKDITADYTLTADDNGYALNVTSNSAIDITVPSGLQRGFNVSVYQSGTGTVHFVESGTTIKNRLSRFSSAGIDAGMGLLSTSDDIFHLTGDLKR